jgi:hypothetical protein
VNHSSCTELKFKQKRLHPRYCRRGARAFCRCARAPPPPQALAPQARAQEPPPPAPPHPLPPPAARAPLVAGQRWKIHQLATLSRSGSCHCTYEEVQWVTPDAPSILRMTSK